MTRASGARLLSQVTELFSYQQQSLKIRLPRLCLPLPSHLLSQVIPVAEAASPALLSSALPSPPGKVVPSFCCGPGLAFSWSAQFFF